MVHGHGQQPNQDGELRPQGAYSKWNPTETAFTVEDPFSGKLLSAAPEIIAALNADGTNSVIEPLPSAPGTGFQAARRGAVLRLVGTAPGDGPGFGGGALEVQIGETTAKVISSGPAAGLKDLWQIEILVPEDTPAAVALHVTVSYNGQEWNSVDIRVE